jgi:hypothetical protein
MKTKQFLFLFSIAFTLSTPLFADPYNKYKEIKDANGSSIFSFNRYSCYDLEIRNSPLPKDTLEVSFCSGDTFAIYTIPDSYYNYTKDQTFRIYSMSYDPALNIDNNLLLFTGSSLDVRSSYDVLNNARVVNQIQSLDFKPMAVGKQKIILTFTPVDDKNNPIEGGVVSYVTVEATITP